jgi:hypothetical protein
MDGKVLISVILNSQTNQIPINSKDNKPLKTLTKSVCEDTGALLMDTQIKQAYRNYYNSLIFF